MSLGLAYVGRDIAIGSDDGDMSSFIVYSSDGANKMVAKNRSMYCTSIFVALVLIFLR